MGKMRGGVIVRNFLSLMVGEAGYMLLRFVAIVYLARVLMVEGFGQLNFAIALVTFFMLFVNFGLNELGVRYVARRPSEVGEFVGSVNSLRIVLALVAFLLMSVTCWWLGLGKTETALVLIVGALLFSYALSVEWAFRGLEQMGPVGKSRIINSLIYLVTLVVLVRDQSDLLIVGACLVAGDIISVLYLARAYQKRVGPIRLRLSVERWRALLQESWPLGVAFAMSTVYFYADFILLRALRDESAVGLYSAAGRLMTIFFTLSIIYVSAVFPRISQLSEESPQELGRFLTQAARAALVVILPAGLLATFLAQPIIQTLYGAAYLGAVRAFQILVWSLAVFVLGHLLSYSLVGQDRQHLYLLILGLGALVNVVANLWWIVPFGIVGAASAKLFSQGLVFVLSYWVLHKSLGLSLAGEIIRTVAAASVMGLVMSALLTWPTPVVVVVGLLLYFGALVAVQGITRADIRQFGAILSAR